MIVGAAGDYLIAPCRKLVRHRLAVAHDVCDVLLVLRGAGLLRCNRLGCDNVHERASLRAGEHCAVHLLCKLRLAEYHTASRTSEGLVRRCRDNVRNAEGALMKLCCDKPRNMRHVDHEVGPIRLVGVLLYDASDAVEVYLPRICACTRKHEPGLMLLYLPVDVVVVDKAFVVNVVKHRFVQLAGEVDR